MKLQSKELWEIGSKRMTKEELKQEAEEYARNNSIIISCDCNYYDSTEDLADAYLASAEPREKRIADLEQQIEKMKRCEICSNSRDWKNRSLCIECEKSKCHINFELRR